MSDVYWGDGQVPWSRRFGDRYFSAEDGLAEARWIFIDHNRLPDRFRSLPPGGVFTVVELGFGTGLNCLATAALFDACAPPGARLFYCAIEAYPMPAADLDRALHRWPELDPWRERLLAAYPPPLPGVHRRWLAAGRQALTLFVGGVEAMLDALPATADAWYLDGFAPARNPEMWQPSVFMRMAARSGAGTTFATYAAAGQVRRDLLGAGFQVFKAPGHGRKREMLYGLWPAPARSATRPPNRRPVTAVIGAGLAGCAVAERLASRGLEVTLWDAAPRLAAAASGNRTAVLMPGLSAAATPQAEFQAAAHVFAAHYYAALFARLGWGHHRPLDSGLLHIADSAATRKRHDELLARFGHVPEVLQPIAPAHTREHCGYRIAAPGLWLPGAGHASPRVLCAAMAAGIARHLGTPIVELVADGARWGLLDNTGATRASVDAVVLAVGMSATLVSALGWLPRQAVAGQLSYARATAQSRRLRCPVCFSAYVTPSFGDVHVLGASYRPNQSDRSIRAEERAATVATVAGLLPELVRDLGPVVADRAAIRCASPDRLPMVGPLSGPELERLAEGLAGPAPKRATGLFVTTAHGSRAAVTAPLSAELLVSQLLGEPPPCRDAVANAVAPRRFLDRRRRKAHLGSPGRARRA